MNFDFVSTLPAAFKGIPVVISGTGSLNFRGVEYLILTGDDPVQHVFEIRFDYHCSPFKEALLIDDVLAVGHEGCFYLYDLVQNVNLTTIEMDGYFSNLYSYGNRVFVTSARSVYCFEKQGLLIWKNNNIGIDGVLIEKFTDHQIYGSGEWDPPGGWRDFVLDIKTGDIIDN